jgi:Mn2+/Fe2+ NRAMP family transporter
MEMSVRDRLTIVAFWAVGFTTYLLIGLDPLDILDFSQKVIIAVIATIVFSTLLLYLVQRIKKKNKKTT